MRLIDADILNYDSGEWNGIGFSSEYVTANNIEKAPTFDLVKHDKEIREDERTKVIDLIDTMAFDFGDFYDHTCEIKEMIKTIITKE